jgi:hypothetical protein
MLVIRQQQMEVLGKYMQKQFEDRLAAHLRTRFPQQTKEMAESAIHALIAGGIEKARRYGISSEDDVRRYVEYMARYGQDFDTDRKTVWARRFLRDKDLDGTSKLNKMDEYELFAVRKES